jgi:hypothetical protein
VRQGCYNMMGNFMERNHTRALAAALALCALATLTLLANHPGGGAHTFPELLRAEAHDKFVAGIVHGGFIATLSALIVCFVFLSRYLGQDRFPVVLGFVAFCVGSGAMMASMIVDGFVVPAVAVRFADVTEPASLAAARTIFVICGTLVRFLMPMGIIFQGIATLGVSSALLHCRGVGRAAGVYGILVGTLLCGSLFVVPSMMSEHVLLIGIVLQAFWYLTISAALFRMPRSTVEV